MSGRVPLPPGSVLALKVDAGARVSEVEEMIRQWVPALRVRHPAVPVVLWVAMDARAVLPLLLRAATLGVSGAVAEDDAVAAGLRESLASPFRVGAGVVEGLRLRRWRVPARAGTLVEQLVDGSAEHAELGPLLHRLREPGGAVCSYLRNHRLPAARDWFQLGRALHAVLALQREPDRPVQEVARGLRYSEAASLSRQLQQVFGARPTCVRSLLGWEWLLDRWAARVQGARSA